MTSQFTQDENQAIHNNEDPENIPLRDRPSISIRTKITISFSLFFILCIAIAGWSYWMLSQLEDKIDFLEITDNYMVEIQQARRFEKNYLLYNTNLDDALVHLKKADTILSQHNDTIENI
ncbi:MAG: histidine kinase, partial [Desulfobacteraceae bacterium]|nr:histidine kinase [Desulfobacteraceae bacterium]